MTPHSNRVPLRARASLIVVLALLLGSVAAVGSGATSTTTQSTPAPPRRPVSVKDSPGYVPLVDSESLSVKHGRRLNAPLVSKPFVGGARTLDELGRAAVRLLNRSSTDSLIALCITESEFRDILWREFPQSRPATGLEWLDGWKALYVRHRGGINGAIRDKGDQFYEYIRTETKDTTAVFRNFKLHNAVTVVVRVNGVQQELRWIRSVAERKGRFKIYSTFD